MNEENWVTIKNTKDYYQVSNLGNVKSIERKVKSRNNSYQTRPSKILKGSIDKYGYRKVILSINNKLKHCTIHRLVALHFIDNPESKRTVNHIDGNKLNNNASNLEWMTNSEQNFHAYKLGLNSKKGILNNNVKLTEQDVLNIRTLLNTTKITIIMKKYNISRTTIRDIKLRITWKNI